MSFVFDYLKGKSHIVSEKKKKTCLRKGMYGVAHMLLLKHNLMHLATAAVCQCVAGSWMKMKQSFGEEQQWSVILTQWDQKIMVSSLVYALTFILGFEIMNIFSVHKSKCWIFWHRRQKSSVKLEFQTIFWHLNVLISRNNVQVRKQHLLASQCWHV